MKNTPLKAFTTLTILVLISGCGASAPNAEINLPAAGTNTNTTPALGKDCQPLVVNEDNHPMQTGETSWVCSENCGALSFNYLGFYWKAVPGKSYGEVIADVGVLENPDTHHIGEYVVTDAQDKNPIINDKLTLGDNPMTYDIVLNCGSFTVNGSTFKYFGFRDTGF